MAAPDRHHFIVRGVTSIMTCLLIGLLRGYQLVLSPLLGPRCRFYPSCSSYGLEAIKVHGPLKGCWLTAKRLSRCHPLGGPGGVDLVPPRKTHASSASCCDKHDPDGAPRP